MSLMGDEEYPASIVGVDRDKDVAVLQLKMPDDVDKKVGCPAQDLHGYTAATQALKYDVSASSTVSLRRGKLHNLGC